MLFPKARRSRRQSKARGGAEGRNPGSGLERHQARETGGSLHGCSPLRWLWVLYYCTPGSHAPGFMLWGGSAGSNRSF
jgi:hypothetical protein